MTYHVWEIQEFGGYLGAASSSEDFVRRRGSYASRTSANRAAAKMPNLSFPFPRRMILLCRPEDPCSECRPRHSSGL